MPDQQTTPQLLNSWKEIATYLSRGVRTVQRWEKMGLPVRRLGQGRRSPVVAYARDIDRWLQAARVNGINTPQSAPHLILHGALHDSVARAQELHTQLQSLCENQKNTVTRLAVTIAALQKSCYNHSPAATTNTPPPARRMRHSAGYFREHHPLV